MVKLYGTSRSRAFRVLWLAHEIGLAYEHDPLPIYKPDAGTYQDWFAAINPNRRIPAIDDDGLKLWETTAINVYLAKKYGGDFYPRDVAGEAKMLQWAFFSVADLDPHSVTIAQNRFVLPPERRVETRVTEALAALQKPFGVLEGALTEAPFLAGSRWGLADLHIASVLVLLLSLKFDLSTYPTLRAWLAASAARPAMKQAASKP